MYLAQNGIFFYKVFQLLDFWLWLDEYDGLDHESENNS